jgi:hypothetical protein
MFNYYIDFYSKDNFVKFYNTINSLICNKYELYDGRNLIFKKFILNYNETKSISSNFNDYLSVLDSIVNDHDYILLNKMQILYQIFYNIKTNSSINYCNYYKLIKSYDNIPYERLESNHKWLERNDKICRKIFSNLQVEYNLYFNIDKFKPISKLELLYDINISQDDDKYKDIENDSNSN